MNDLEIKSRIAAIEGHTIEHITRETVFIFDRNLSDVTGIDEYINYNPFDDALCFQLMVKYKVSAEYFYGKWCTRVKTAKGHVLGSNEKDLNKAILLAIIESKKV